MEFLAIILACAMLVGLIRCSDVSVIEKNVQDRKEFSVNGREYFCLRTPKQMTIDELEHEIHKVKAQK